MLRKVKEVEIIENNLIIKTESGIALVFDKADSFIEDLAAVKYKDKWGYINKKGRQIIKPIYDEVEHFINSLAVVKYKSKWGCIDKNNKLIFPFEYDKVSVIIKSILAVNKNHKIGWVNKNKLEIVNCNPCQGHFLI